MENTEERSSADYGYNGENRDEDIAVSSFTEYSREGKPRGG